MSRKGFTIVELIIVIVCLGLLAVFAIPNYVATMGRARERQIAANINAISANVLLYEKVHGQTPRTDLNSLNEINAALDLELLSDGQTTYFCDFNSSPDYFECVGNSRDGWWLHSKNTGAWSNTAHCAAGSGPCPACNQVDGTRCPWG